MARLFLVALLTLAFSGVAFTAPPASQDIVVVNNVHATASWSYTDCGLPTDGITIKSLKVSPDPPKPGQPLTVRLNADVSKTVQDGAYADVVVKLGLIKLLSKRFDICEEARKANATVQCPVEPGGYMIEHTVSLPKEIPPARFNIEILGFSDDEEDMFCLRMTANFLPSRGFQ